MFKEILQSHIGLGKDQDLHSSAPGFSYPNSIEVLSEHYHKGYKPLADTLSKMFKGNEFILELGCGGGNLSYFIRQNHPNIKYVTLDINQDTPKVSPYINPDNHFVVYTDRPYQIHFNNQPVRFDYILSYEHFEHIAPYRISRLLHNIRIHSHPFTKIIATVATTGGDAHPSGYPKEIWEEILADHNFKILNESYLTKKNCPANFTLDYTSEFVFRT